MSLRRSLSPARFVVHAHKWDSRNAHFNDQSKTCSLGRGSVGPRVGSFSDGDHAPFVLLVEASGQRQLMDLQSASGSSEDLLTFGRELIQKFADGQLYVLVWDGFLTTDGKRQDAVFAEAGASEGQALIFAQRYKASRSGKLFEVGAPVAAAEAAHLWREADARDLTVSSHFP